MLIVSGLCRLCRYIMANFWLLDWLWRKLCGFCCCIRRLSTPLYGFSRRLLSLNWRGNEESGPERSEENSGPVSGASTENVRSALDEVLHGAKLESENEQVDEFYCEYDSTWECEQSQEGTPRRARRARRSAASRNMMFRRFESAARDMQNYRRGYPNQMRARSWHGHDSKDTPNLDFYLGLIPFAPNGVRITVLHEGWFGQYDLLESVHTYIQWLFPLEEPGVNYEASPLTKEEIKEFNENAVAKKHLLDSYKLMLDFYGIELCDEQTGDVRRASNWRNRFNNLNRHTHNNLRITRILKCLGTLGYRDYQAPLVHFFLNETLVNKELPNVRDSALNYFVYAVLDKEKRQDLIKFAYSHYDHPDEFVWCPKKIQMLWSSQGSSHRVCE